MSGVNRLVVALLALVLLLFALLMVSDFLAAVHDASEYRDVEGRSLTRYLVEDSLLLLIGLAGAVGGAMFALGGKRFAKGAWVTCAAALVLVLWLLLHYLRA